MANCTSIDPFVTAYVDDELDAGRRQTIDDHLLACPPCRARVIAERAMRRLMRAKRSELADAAAPSALRGRCAEAVRNRTAGAPAVAATPPRTWRARVAPLALAASLIVIVGGTFLYQLTDRSARVMAAELTADHVKCFGVLNPLFHTNDAPATVEQSMAAMFGWQMELPRSAERAGLELVGARPCLYGKGMVAHLMYRHNGEPVSVFMLPKTVRADEVLDVMGHEASIWSAGGRTFVLIAREPRAEVARLTSFVQDALR